jgi:hypothetical protein
MQQSEQRGLRSEFFFLVDDSGYQLEQPWIAGLMQQINQRGHGIGVHPPAGSYQDQIKLAQVVERFRAALHSAGLEQLSRAPLAGRQHLFQWSAPETWRMYNVAGLSTDCSCYYPQQAGFRCGSCWSYQTCDLREGRSLQVMEDPLIAMEVSLLAPRYAGLSLALAAQRMIELGKACRAVTGDFVLLWHNEHLISKHQQAACLGVLDALLDNSGSVVASTAMSSLAAAEIDPLQQSSD